MSIPTEDDLDALEQDLIDQFDALICSVQDLPRSSSREICLVQLQQAKLWVRCAVLVLDDPAEAARVALEAR